MGDKIIEGAIDVLMFVVHAENPRAREGIGAAYGQLFGLGEAGGFFREPDGRIASRHNHPIWELAATARLLQQDESPALTYERTCINAAARLYDILTYLPIPDAWS